MKTSTITIRVTDYERQMLERIAAERSASIGSVVRWSFARAIGETPPDVASGRNAKAPEVHEAAGAFDVQS